MVLSSVLMYKIPLSFERLKSWRRHRVRQEMMAIAGDIPVFYNPIDDVMVMNLPKNLPDDEKVDVLERMKKNGFDVRNDILDEESRKILQSLNVC